MSEEIDNLYGYISTARNEIKVTRKDKEAAVENINRLDLSADDYARNKEFILVCNEIIKEYEDTIKKCQVEIDALKG